MYIPVKIAAEYKKILYENLGKFLIAPHAPKTNNTK